MKGRKKVGEFRDRKRAQSYLASIRHKFKSLVIEEGTHTVSGGLGVKTHKVKVWRVWAK